MKDKDVQENQQIPEVAICDTCGCDCEQEEEDKCEVIRAKWTIDGANSLSEAAEMLEMFATHLRNLERNGWQLQEEICDDYGFIRKDE